MALVLRLPAGFRLLVLAVVSTVLLLADDFLQQLYTLNNRAELEGAYVASMFVVSVCLLTAGSRFFAGLVLGLFAAMQLMQLAHISFIGDPLTPVDISRLGGEWEEVSLTIVSVMADHWFVLLAWALPYGLLAWFYWQVLPVTKSRWAPIAIVMVLMALASKPHRAMSFDMIHFMPGPARSSLHNSLNAFSYYIMRMSFGRESVRYPSYLPYRVMPVSVSARPDRIWLVLGESLRSDRMGVYGYGRDTTPRLSVLRDAGRLVVIPGQAASVATGSTIPLLVNGVAEPGNIAELRRKTANLFRLAKASGYGTFWLSSQESKLMSDIGQVDRHVTREDFPVDYARDGDRALLTELERLSPGAKAFGIIQTRTAHIPYESAYSRDESFLPVWPDGDDLSVSERQSNQYDNALRYFDDMAADLLDMADGQSGTTLVVITSDHGQMLGEQGRWGHNVLTPEVAAVPMLIYQAGGGGVMPAAARLTHQQLHAWLAGRMGWHVDIPGLEPGVSWFQGNDLYGDNLFVRITEQNGRVIWDAPGLVSRLARGRTAGVPAD